MVVDVRDVPELWKDGAIPGAVHASRGILEFNLDPEGLYFIEEPGEGSELLFVRAAGGRSALVAECAQEMGLRNVASVGGVVTWQEAGGPVEDAPPSM